VLVADDSPAFLRAAVAVVAAADGFELVGVARSGEDAVATAERVRPDLVLLDIRMPGVGGVEAARLIHESNRRAVVVMITASPGWGLPADAMRCGASAAMKKEDVLPGTLAELWQRHRPG
jgi:DNA-binding NarL/FixJ family response regulator